MALDPETTLWDLATGFLFKRKQITPLFVNEFSEVVNDFEVMSSANVTLREKMKVAVRLTRQYPEKAECSIQRDLNSTYGVER